jgi:hypothetical protein
MFVELCGDILVLSLRYNCMLDVFRSCIITFPLYGELLIAWCACVGFIVGLFILVIIPVSSSKQIYCSTVLNCLVMSSWWVFLGTGTMDRFSTIWAFTRSFWIWRRLWANWCDCYGCPAVPSSWMCLERGYKIIYIGVPPAFLPMDYLKACPTNTLVSSSMFASCWFCSRNWLGTWIYRPYWSRPWNLCCAIATAAEADTFNWFWLARFCNPPNYGWNWFTLTAWRWLGIEW